MNRISIELRIIISLVLFIFLIVVSERYQISKNVKEQFIESKKSKNELLIKTLTPVISLNMSLGLEGANEEYLDQIFSQNQDISYIEIVDNAGSVIYKNSRAQDPKSVENTSSLNFCTKDIIDSLTKTKLGKIKIYFENNDYKKMLQQNKMTTINVFVLMAVLVAIFIFFVKKEFKELKELTQKVMDYDPKENNFDLKISKRTDEVGIIKNAIIMMVEKIASYTKLLDEVNHSLELKVKERTEELEKLNAFLEEQSLTDPLTQLPNRRHFEQYAQKIWGLAKREDVSVSVIMCDIDFFKQINDTYGHLNGDKVLIELAKILKDSLKRDTDFVARYGGEEFIIILYNTNNHDAKELCENIQEKITQHTHFDFEKDLTRTVTMSFGISSTVPKGSELQNLIDASDKALYEAKDAGRNCIKIRSIMID